MHYLYLSQASTYYLSFSGDVQQLSHRSGYSDLSSVSTSKRGVGTMKAKGPRYIFYDKQLLDAFVLACLLLLPCIQVNLGQTRFRLGFLVRITDLIFVTFLRQRKVS